MSLIFWHVDTLGVCINSIIKMFLFCQSLDLRTPHPGTQTHAYKLLLSLLSLPPIFVNIMYADVFFSMLVSEFFPHKSFYTITCNMVFFVFYNCIDIIILFTFFILSFLISFFIFISFWYFIFLNIYFVLY